MELWETKPSEAHGLENLVSIARKLQRDAVSNKGFCMQVCTCQCSWEGQRPSLRSTSSPATNWEPGPDSSHQACMPLPTGPAHQPPGFYIFKVLIKEK